MQRISVFPLFVLLLSCTVVENRDGGPCTLYESSGDMRPVNVSLWRAGICEDGASSDSPADFEFTLEREDYLVTASSESPNTIVRDGVIYLQRESPVDSVYAYSRNLNCNCEWVCDTVARRKQFATVTIAFNISPRHDRFPDSLRVISNWDGLDVRTMRPVRGDYGHTFVCTGIEQSFRILRQGDDSLVLRLISRTKGIVDDVPLGRFLSRAGYSWGDEDLKDVKIEIEEAAAKLKLIILDWEDGEPLIIEI